MHTEKKYLLDDIQYITLRNKLSLRLTEKETEDHSVCRLCFDTPDMLMAERSLEKPSYKEELSVRSCGVPSEATMVTVRLTKRYKDRFLIKEESLTYGDALKYMAGKASGDEGRIYKEVMRLRRNYDDIRPSMVVSYQRLAMNDPHDRKLGITFDKDIRWRDYDMDLTKGIYGRYLLSPGMHVMQITSPGKLPAWLSEILEEMKIFPASYSSYESAYRASLKNSGSSLVWRKFEDSISDPGKSVSIKDSICMMALLTQC